MNTMARALGLLWLGAVVAGCGPQAKGARGTTPSDPCHGAGANLERLDWLRMRNAPDGPVREPLVELLASSCRSEAWSGELIACMTATPTMKDYGACRPMLSEHQFDRLEGVWGDWVERVSTEATAAVVTAACAAAKQLTDEVAAATDGARAARVIWTGADGDLSTAYAAAVAALEECKPAIYTDRSGPTTGETPTVLWTGRVAATFDAHQTGSFSDAPSARDTMFSLWLEVAPGADGASADLKLTATR
ncbi:MAG: hypothetical protein IPH44_02630 [Myxococcales bacterium]|jgi:hypothetical protein|nr:hypothetical protein [Myxococcales bacterium]MBP6849070.1 hypothetical protein [Kofleriaceae bacterium]